MRISDWSSDVCSSDLLSRRDLNGRTSKPIVSVRMGFSNLSLDSRRIAPVATTRPPVSPDLDADRNPDFSKCGSTLGASVDVLCRNGRIDCVKEDGLPLSFYTHQACNTTRGLAEYTPEKIPREPRYSTSGALLHRIQSTYNLLRQHWPTPHAQHQVECRLTTL